MAGSSPDLLTRRLLGRAAAGWPYLAVGGWLVLSVLLYERTGVDLRLPCLVELASGLRCPGCGLTTALGAALSGDLAAAWSANPLLFVLAPAGLACWLTGGGASRPPAAGG